jgi:hypothetical protein
MCDPQDRCVFVRQSLFHWLSPVVVSDNPLGTRSFTSISIHFLACRSAKPAPRPDDNLLVVHAFTLSVIPPSRAPIPQSHHNTKNLSRQSSMVGVVMNQGGLSPHREVMEDSNPEDDQATKNVASNLDNLMARVHLGTTKRMGEGPPSNKACSSPKTAKSRTRRGGTRRQRDNQDVPSPPVASSLIIPRSGWERRSSMASCSSMSSAEEPPKRKIIRLRPHRSQDLYDAQRQDDELRALLKERAPGLTVRKVHGKSLVFYDSTRVYVPETLRQETLKYYRKNYKYSHKQRMEESCYWPRMDRDYRREFQFKVKITDPETKESRLVYDSDDYEFPSH